MAIRDMATVVARGTRWSFKTTQKCVHCGTNHGHGLVSKHCGTPVFVYTSELRHVPWDSKERVPAPDDAIHWMEKRSEG